MKLYVSVNESSAQLCDYEREHTQPQLSMNLMGTLMVVKLNGTQLSVNLDDTYLYANLNMVHICVRT